ncbi:hypothetical protein GCM10022224_012380 [Nonomuraea antimicrobica]|uniref:Uncharacterized protein n=1 Tax=Nonomuraea antimicrobica TaxID=561173 RepID=A0ABP7B6L1_9ACTN
MGDGLRADDRVRPRRVARGVATTCAEAAARASAFHERMAAYGTPWGVNNPVSRALGLCYRTARDEHAARHPGHPAACLAGRETVGRAGDGAGGGARGTAGGGAAVAGGVR